MTQLNLRKVGEIILVTQKYDCSDYTGTNTYFIIAKSENQMYDEMKNFIKEHGTDKNEIWVYFNPIEPNKVNLRPEYSMELEIIEKSSGMKIMSLYERIW